MADTAMSHSCSLDVNDSNMRRLFGGHFKICITNMWHRKLIAPVLSISILCWIALFFFSRDTSMHIVYTISVSVVIWIPVLILVLLMANSKATAMTLRSIEFWIRLIFSLMFSIAFTTDSFLHFCSVISLSITFLLLITVISLFDALEWPSTYKSISSGSVTLALSVFVVFAHLDFDTTNNNGEENDLSTYQLTSIQVTTATVVAVFLWRQSILHLQNKNHFVLIPYHTSVQWVDGHVSKTLNIGSIRNHMNHPQFLGNHGQVPSISDITFTTSNPTHIPTASGNVNDGYDHTQNQKSDLLQVVTGYNDTKTDRNGYREFDGQQSVDDTSTIMQVVIDPPHRSGRKEEEDEEEEQRSSDIEMNTSILIDNNNSIVVGTATTATSVTANDENVYQLSVHESMARDQSKSTSNELNEDENENENAGGITPSIDINMESVEIVQCSQSADQSKEAMTSPIDENATKSVPVIKEQNVFTITNPTESTENAMHYQQYQLHTPTRKDTDDVDQGTGYIMVPGNGGNDANNSNGTESTNTTKNEKNEDDHKVTTTTDIDNKNESTTINIENAVNTTMTTRTATKTTEVTDAINPDPDPTSLGGDGIITNIDHERTDDDKCYKSTATKKTNEERIESKTDEIISESKDSKPITTKSNTDGLHHIDHKKEEELDPEMEMESKTESVDIPQLIEPETIPLPIPTSTMKEEFKYKTGLKDKDLKLGLEHTFKDIPVNVFWEWFWSQNAKFSPIDWIKEDPLTSDVSGTAVVPLLNNNDSNDDGLEWYTRTISCTRKITDAPSFVTAVAKESKSDFTHKYCEIKPGFYLIHIILNVSGAPLSDVFRVHQKYELRQEMHKGRGGGDDVTYSTHIRMYNGIEWRKSSMFKKMIKSKSLNEVNSNIAKYCEFIDDQILKIKEQLKREKENYETRMKEIKSMNSKAKKQLAVPPTAGRPTSMSPMSVKSDEDLPGLLDEVFDDVETMLSDRSTPMGGS